MNELLQQALGVWSAGGWAMYALAFNAVLLFGVGTEIWLRLVHRQYRDMGDQQWKDWIASPGARQGPVGELLDSALQARTPEELDVRFAELRAGEIDPFERDLKFMKVCVAAAPLFGLLGTVTGMLVTFEALATGAGGQKTMDMIARGISEALITTETGLVIALAGFFLQYHLRRERDRYAAFLLHIETLCTQALHRQAVAPENRA